MYISEDDPSISLKLTFDKMTPEFYNFMYLLTILAVYTTIYLFLLILEFVSAQSITAYKILFDTRDYTRVYHDE
jgi:hypothetical protein